MEVHKQPPYMKTLAFLLFLISAQQLSAQKIEQFYDYAWKRTAPETARYYALIEKKDSVWLRKDYFIHERSLQMVGTFTDTSFKVEHGDFEYYHANGSLSSKGKYVYGKRDGLWLQYYNNGMIADSAVYDHGNVVGTRLSWHSNGYMSDSAVYNPDGSGVIISWFDNGVPSSAGRQSAGHNINGPWQFFHRNGKLASFETYKNGTLLDKKYYDEEGNAMADTTSKDREPTFPGGQKAWQKFMMKQLYFPDQYKFDNADIAVAVIGAVIDEEGNVTEIQVTDPLHPDFDRIAVNMMKRSPKWLPAISHNRRVKFSIRQPISFVQNQFP